MMLVRELGNFPKLHLGPRAGGIFWALKGANDLPQRGGVIEQEARSLISSGQLWMQDAENPGGWTEILSSDDIPQFEKIWYDDYEAVTTISKVKPFMPEFYWVPNHDIALCTQCGYIGMPDIEGYRPLCPECYENVDFDERRYYQREVQ